MSSSNTTNLIFIVGGIKLSGYDLITTNDFSFKFIVELMFLNPVAHNACYKVNTFIFIGASSMSNFLFIGTCKKVPFFSQVHI